MRTEEDSTIELKSEIIYTDAFHNWFNTLTEPTQKIIWDYGIRYLGAHGADLTFPIKGELFSSKHQNLYELRIREPSDFSKEFDKDKKKLIVFYAIDDRMGFNDEDKTIVVLAGGDPMLDFCFYDEMIPKVDQIYDQHLAES